MGVRRADGVARRGCGERMLVCAPRRAHDEEEDRKSTRLNSSHDQISYAVFCLKKKKKKRSERTYRVNKGTRTRARPSRPRGGTRGPSRRRPDRSSHQLDRLSTRRYAGCDGDWW